MKDNFYYVQLFEVYKSLLTKKQSEIFEMHLLLDLSLSEIAEEKGITRQNVSDTLKNAKDKLENYEKELKLKAKTSKLMELCNNLPDDISNEIKEIIEL